MSRSPRLEPRPGRADPLAERFLAGDPAPPRPDFRAALRRELLARPPTPTGWRLPLPSGRALTIPRGRAGPVILFAGLAVLVLIWSSGLPSLPWTGAGPTAGDSTSPTPMSLEPAPAAMTDSVAGRRHTPSAALGPDRTAPVRSEAAQPAEPAALAEAPDSGAAALGAPAPAAAPVDAPLATPTSAPTQAAAAVAQDRDARREKPGGAPSETEPPSPMPTETPAPAPSTGVPSALPSEVAPPTSTAILPVGPLPTVTPPPTEPSPPTTPPTSPSP